MIGVGVRDETIRIPTQHFERVDGSLIDGVRDPLHFFGGFCFIGNHLDVVSRPETPIVNDVGDDDCGQPVLTGFQIDRFGIVSDDDTTKRIVGFFDAGIMVVEKLDLRPVQSPIVDDTRLVSDFGEPFKKHLFVIGDDGE